MTAFTTFAALLPVMLATGRGADVARAMALPVFSGMLIELVSLFVVPVLYCAYMQFSMDLGIADKRWQAESSQSSGIIPSDNGARCERKNENPNRQRASPQIPAMRRGHGHSCGDERPVGTTSG